MGDFWGNYRHMSIFHVRFRFARRRRSLHNNDSCCGVDAAVYRKLVVRMCAGAQGTLRSRTCIICGCIIGMGIDLVCILRVGSFWYRSLYWCVWACVWCVWVSVSAWCACVHRASGGKSERSFKEPILPGRCVAFFILLCAQIELYASCTC